MKKTKKFLLTLLVMAIGGCAAISMIVLMTVIIQLLLNAGVGFSPRAKISDLDMILYPILSISNLVITYLFMTDGYNKLNKAIQ